MLTVFYSPHMTSVDNEAKRASGHADIPLSALGRQQAQEFGQAYPQDQIAQVDTIFCSDLQRAITTAQLAFTRYSLPIIPDARLRECDYGDLTQFPTSQIDEEFIQRVTVPFPHGESVSMVVQRVGAFLNDTLRNYEGRTIIVIGHRATRYALNYWSSDTPLDQIVNAAWEWLDVPIWRYEFQTQMLEQRSVSL